MKVGAGETVNKLTASQMIEKIFACTSQEEADEMFREWDELGMFDDVVEMSCTEFHRVVVAMGEFHLKITGCACRLRTPVQ